MAMLKATSRLKPFEQGEGLLKYQIPSVFKEFVVGCVRDLSVNDRAAFRFFCLGNVPGSKLDVNLESDDDIFKLIEFLVRDSTLSVKDVSFLERYLSKIGREDIIQKLEQVELRMFLGNIVEGYVKLSDCVRKDGSLLERAGRSDRVVDLLKGIKKRNKCLIEEILNQLSRIDSIYDGTDDVDGTFLRICDEIIRSDLSWSGFMVCLVIIGELYGSYGLYFGTPVDVAASDGYYVCAFSGTRTSQLLAEWILENGGMVSEPNISIITTSFRYYAAISHRFSYKMKENRTKAKLELKVKIYVTLSFSKVAS